MGMTSAEKMRAKRQRDKPRAICPMCGRTCLICGRDQRDDPHKHVSKKKPARKTCESCSKNAQERVERAREEAQG